MTQISGQAQVPLFAKHDTRQTESQDLKYRADNFEGNGGSLKEKLHTNVVNDGCRGCPSAPVVW